MADRIHFWKRDSLEEQYLKLEKENFDIKNKYTKLELDTKLQIKELVQKIDKIEPQLQRMTAQHQQDCIRINELTVTVSVLSRMYCDLRKTVGLD